MKRTYEEILDSMKNAYFSECGSAVEDNSQTLKRFEILASELYSISCYGDYIFKQAFVQSATGECLDRLGELRACVRKEASGSAGELTFYISQACNEDIAIPSGTVCSVSAKPYMQFATTQPSVIVAGELECTVQARSLGQGDDYNVSVNEITAMVNAPIGVTGVTNRNKFSGGYSTESDEAYRKRILRHYGILPNGINCTSYENRVLTLDYITDCKIVAASTSNRMKIYVATKSNSLSDEQIEEIAHRIPVILAAGILYQVILAERIAFNLTVNADVMIGFDADSISQEIEQALRQTISASRIGECIPLSRLRRAIFDIEALADFEIYSPQLVGDVIYTPDSASLSLADIEVRCSYV